MTHSELSFHKKKKNYEQSFILINKFTTLNLKLGYSRFYILIHLLLILLGTYLVTKLFPKIKLKFN